MAQKGGEENSCAKLTVTQVKAIWKRMQKGVSCIRISKDYPQVHYGTIARIYRGESWNNVTGLPVRKSIARPKYW